MVILSVFFGLLFLIFLFCCCKFCFFSKSLRTSVPYEPYISSGLYGVPQSSSGSSLVAIPPRSIDIPLVALTRPSVDTLPVYTPSESSGFPAGFSSLVDPVPAYAR